MIMFLSHIKIFHWSVHISLPQEYIPPYTFDHASFLQCPSPWPRPGVSKLQAAFKTWPAVSFCEVLIEHNSVHSFAYFSLAAFVLKWKSWRATTDTTSDPQSTKYLLSSPLKKKKSGDLSSTLDLSKSCSSLKAQLKVLLSPQTIMTFLFPSN